ncbi:hypothetical protein MXB_4775 [Myxobolus squamalis]|nr:hypothetical protein MXB_4775 [Myxobolus squamalis]
MLCIHLLWLPCADKSNFEEYSAHWQAYLWEAIADTGEFLSAKTYTVDQIQIHSMDLWLTPNDIYLIKC